MAKNNIDVVVKGDYTDKDIQRAIKDLEKIQATSQGLEGRMKKLGSSVQEFGGKVSSVGGKLTAGVTLPILAAGGAMVAFAKEAEEAEVANRKLGNVLDSMGFGEAAGRVQAYAEELERTIAVDAELIKATQTKLATFKNLTATVDQSGGAFDRATMAALDLAAAGFGSAESNAVQLGKALQDPVKGITALARAGVTFTEQEREKIKALVESGNILEAQNMILGAIETQVGGTAEAGASSFERIRLSLLQIAETIGTAVLPLIQKLADYISNTIVPAVVPKIEAMVAAFNNLDPGTKKAIGAAIAFAAALGPVLLIVGKVISAVGGIIGVFNPLTLKIAAVVLAVAAVVAAFKLMWDRSQALREAVGSLIATVQNIARVLVNDVLAAFRSVTGGAGDARSIFERVARVAGDVLGVAIRILTTYWTALANGVRVAIKAFEVIWKVLEMTANILKGVVLAAIDILLNRLGPVSAALRNFGNGVKNGFTIVANAVIALFRNLAPGVEKFVNFAIRAVNGLIKVYNGLADVLPGVSKVSEIAAFKFGELSVSIEETAKSSSELANEANAARYSAMAGVTNWDAYNNALGRTTKGSGDLVTGLDDLTASTGSAGSAVEKSSNKLEKFKEKFNEIAARLKSAREEIEADYKGMAETVQRAIMGSLDFSDALPELDEQGNQVGGSFMDRLNAQAERAAEFASRVRTLIQMGLSPEALTMVLQEGITAGTSIANELINGGATAIDQTNKLIESTTGAATEIGTFAADAFYGTGLQLAINAENGFQKRFGEGGPGYNKLNRMMSSLAASMERTTVITVVTRHVSEAARLDGRRATGGPVLANKAYLVGERGPEVLMMGAQSGTIIPNHELATTTRSGTGVIAAGGSTINLTVNAGMGTNGPEVGRQIVEALKQYERRNGPVYASA